MVTNIIKTNAGFTVIIYSEAAEDIKKKNNYLFCLPTKFTINSVLDDVHDDVIITIN